MPEILINAPPETVWNAISDLKRHVEWSPNLTIEALDDGELAVGSKFTSAPPNAKGPDQLTVTGLEANSRISYRSQTPGSLAFDFEMTVQPQGDGTLLTRTAKAVKGPLPLRLLINLVIAGMNEGKYLKVIRDGLEGSQD